MLGQPVTMLIPQVIGFKLSGSLRAGRDRHRSGADGHRDAAQERRGRQVRRVLRRRPGEPAARRPRHHRQHVAGIRQHLRHLPDRRGDASATWSSRAGRAEQIALVEAYAKAQGLWRVNGAARRRLHRRARARPRRRSSRASPGPSRPQDRVPLRIAKSAYRDAPQEAWPRSARKKNPDRHRHGGRRPSTARASRSGRRGADRRHHQLHQHLESLRDDGRRTAGAQRAPARACTPSPG